jgi:hypothetical protein
MSRHALTLFNPTLRKAAAVDALKKVDPQLQRRTPPTFARARRIVIAVLLIALLAGVVISVRLAHYMPASELGSVIEHLKFWK